MPKTVNNTDAQILRVIEPDLDALNVKAIEIIDKEDESLPSKENKKGDKLVKSYPLIQIGNRPFEKNQIRYMSLSNTGFIPILDITLEDNSGYLNDLMFPKDGDLVQLRLGANNEEDFKSIRIDFEILDIRSFRNQISISGKMKIPGDEGEESLVLQELTSFDALLEIADVLNLGYATNEKETIDSMTWINPFGTRFDFIKEITERSYKDDDSFFTSYIDYHYYLNFVNVNNQFITQEGSEDTNMGLGTDFNKYVESDSEGSTNSFSDVLILTNMPNKKSTTLYISEYKPFTRSGTVVHKNGYKRYVQFFDRELYEYQSQYVDPLTTPGKEDDFILPKGRPGNEDYKLYNKYKWVGHQDNFNTHENYQYSLIHNTQNLQEVEKLGMDITLPNPNFSLYKYQVIPVAIIIEKFNQELESDIRDSELGEENQEPKSEQGADSSQQQKRKEPRLNKILTGHYVIRDINFLYENGKLYQKITLLRREWPIQKRKDIQ